MKTLTSPEPLEFSTAPQSTELGKSPSLSHRGLTILLIVMCIVPLTTVAAIWQFLPAVYEGQLEARVTAAGLPPAEYYAIDYRQREPFKGGEIVVENLADQAWTHLNIQVNRHYQIYDTEPIPAGGKRRFALDRFISRTGARFSLRYNQLQSVRVYARRPTKDRATYFKEFDVAH